MELNFREWIKSLIAFQKFSISFNKYLKTLVPNMQYNSRKSAVKPLSSFLWVWSFLNCTLITRGTPPKAISSNHKPPLVNFIKRMHVVGSQKTNRNWIEPSASGIFYLRYNRESFPLLYLICLPVPFDFYLCIILSRLSALTSEKLASWLVCKNTGFINVGIRQQYWETERNRNSEANFKQNCFWL